MSIADRTSPAADVRNHELGTMLVGLGAIVLLVSLFLEWYDAGVDAWEAFEVWDLVLAALAITALVAAASRFGIGAPRPSSWLIGAALAAFVIVLFVLLNPPPNVADVDDDPATGLWLALAGTILMAAGALMAVARISVAFDSPGGGLRHGHGVPGHHTTGDPPVVEHGGPRMGRRFGRGQDGPAVGEPVDPVAPGAAPPTEPTRRI